MLFLEHRRRDADAALGRLFLSGVSTRKLKSIAREPFGKEVSSQTVSHTLAYLDQEFLWLAFCLIPCVGSNFSLK